MSVHESLKSLPEWNRLVEMVRELAFLDGGSDDAFTLASGRQSRWFFDMKPVMMHTESSKLLAHLFNHRTTDCDRHYRFRIRPQKGLHGPKITERSRRS